eukprot:TRINITY_DN12187_c0_g1_i2.p1 TRINITY_DN12187_c0_g1~~TRINITY_DN12187_c0_g1_i2.p1  ORF type:complete len:414 (+),score=18.88 TRINITY_DN12187_c0_g1_i2:57-1244(+)
MTRKCLYVVYFLVCVVNDCVGAPRAQLQGAIASDQSVVDRGFTTVADFNVDEYFQFSRHYHKDVYKRNFNGHVLGYITPWNAEGFLLSELFYGKFTHLSPVWYQVRSVSGIYQLVGRHDVKQDWLNKIRNNGQGGNIAHPKIVPRFVFEIPPSELPSYDSAMDNIIDMIIKEIEWGQYDGMVLEAWTQWSYIATKLPGLKNSFMTPFVKKLSNALHSVSGKSLELVLVVPPTISPSSGLSFSTDDFLMLEPLVDMFSVCTYDYSTVVQPGANAPFQWVDSNMQQLSYAAKKPAALLMGLNFYGMDYDLDNYQNSGPITYKDFITILQNNEVVSAWDDSSKEHSFTYSESGKSNRHVMYYPTVKTLSERIQLAKQIGVGISIWELGQGLESFFDLL